jgi:hypothetical protein
VGSSNVLYYSTYLGMQLAQGIGMTWTLAGSRTGDGTIPLTIGNSQSVPALGLFLWYVQSTSGGNQSISNPVFQALTDQTTSVHYRCLQGLQQRVYAANLSGISTSQIMIMDMPRQWEGLDNLPNIRISPIGKEGQVGYLNNRDDIEYPCLVAIVDRANQDQVTNLPRNLLWRQKIFRAFRNQPLLGVPEIINTHVDPDYVINPEQFNLRNLWYSAILFKPVSREVRG